MVRPDVLWTSISRSWPCCLKCGIKVTLGWPYWDVHNWLYSGHTFGRPSLINTAQSPLIPPLPLHHSTLSHRLQVTCPKGHLSKMQLCRFLNLTLNLTLILALTQTLTLCLYFSSNKWPFGKVNCYLSHLVNWDTGSALTYSPPHSHPTDPSGLCTVPQSYDKDSALCACKRAATPPQNRMGSEPKILRTELTTTKFQATWTAITDAVRVASTNGKLTTETYVWMRTPENASLGFVVALSGFWVSVVTGAAWEEARWLSSCAWTWSKVFEPIITFESAELFPGTSPIFCDVKISSSNLHTVRSKWQSFLSTNSASSPC